MQTRVLNINEFFDIAHFYFDKDVEIILYCQYYLREILQAAFASLFV